LYNSDSKDLPSEFLKKEKEFIEKSRFGAAYNSIKETDVVSKAKKGVFKIAVHVDNIQKLFKLYKAPKGFKLPTLYRGIVTTQQFRDPFAMVAPGESVVFNQISSCSLQPATAVKFQRCSGDGPCCLLRLTVDPDVKFIPIFWESGESYVGSEHEVILEPMCEFKLVKKGTARISQNIGVYCDYNKFNNTGHITLNLYDIQVSKPKKESVTEFNTFMESLEKGAPVRNYEIKLSF
jgi:hypothetical protein